MSLVALAVLACLVGTSLTLPIDYGFLGLGLGLGLDGFSGPYSPDFYRRGLGGFGALPSPRFGPFLPGDSLDTVSADLLTRYRGDYLYPGYPRTVGVSKENFVRGDGFGTEIGVRDEVTFRPGGLRSPYPRYYCNYYPYNVLRFCRRPFDDSVFTTAADFGFRRPFLGLGVGGTDVGDVVADGLLLK